MKRTGAWTFVMIGVGGLVIGWLAELLLVTVGRAVVVPPYPLAGALLACARSAPRWSTSGARSDSTA